jgi:hypothetical protein
VGDGTIGSGLRLPDRSALGGYAPCESLSRVTQNRSAASEDLTTD